jgi:ribose transport system substrate-binding protein
MVYVIEPPVGFGPVPGPSDHHGISIPRSPAMRAYSSSLARLRRGVLAAGACFAVVFQGCSDTTPRPDGAGPAPAAGVKRFIFVTNGDDPFWDACNAGLQEGGRRFGLESKNLRVVMEKNNGTAQGQIEKLRQFGSQSDIAGVAISVIQAENAAIVEEMKNLAAKGVQVITVDGDVNREKFRDARAYYIGTDNIVGGRLLGSAAKAILKARGRQSGGYVQFAGFTDNDNARARMDGFEETVGDAFKEVDRMSDEMDLSKARDNVRTALVNHPDLAVLVGIWAYNAPAIAEVVQERGVRERVSVVTFDAQAAAIERMAAGQIDAMVVQNPFEMGVQAVRLLLAMHSGDEAVLAEMFPAADKPDGDIYTTGLRLIAPDTAPLVEPDDIDVKGFEYMPLSRFRDWLAKYGLSSS